MLYSRRNILKNAGLVSLGSSLALPRKGNALGVPPLFEDGYPDRKKIITAAIDSALANGASYADGRLIHNERLMIYSDEVRRGEVMSFGIRVLYKGYWGYAASPIWTVDEAARLGKSAVFQAKATVLGRERVTDLAPIKDLSSGHWETPVIDNPFKTHYDELIDYGNALRAFIGNLKYISTQMTGFSFERHNKAYASSEGQYVTQVLYHGIGGISFSLKDYATNEEAGNSVEEVTYASAGVEYVRNASIRDQIRRAHEEAVEDMRLPIKPVDVGRYNVLLDQWSLANVLNKSLGAATELDRALGFEANAGGTSFINEPETMIGSLKVGSPKLNIECDSTRVGSIGNMKWDDEGVQPEAYDLVKDGILVDMQTNREGAGWLNRSELGNTIVRESRGSTRSTMATYVPLLRKGDLVLKSDAGDVTHEDLRAGIKEGIEFRTASADVDFQQTTGVVTGRAYEIRDGKRIARLGNAGLLFRTSELWSNLERLGGQSSSRYFGISSNKGQPVQEGVAGVYSPPAIFKEMTLIDTTRKA